MNEPQQLTTLQTHWPLITVAAAWLMREWHQNGMNFNALQTYCDSRTNGLLPFAFRCVFGSPKQTADLKAIIAEFAKGPQPINAPITLDVKPADVTGSTVGAPISDAGLKAPGVAPGAGLVSEQISGTTPGAVNQNQESK